MKDLTEYLLNNVDKYEGKTYEELEEMTLDMLNDDSSVSICGYTMNQGDILKALDPIAFNQEVSFYIDNNSYGEYGDYYFDSYYVDKAERDMEEEEEDNEESYFERFKEVEND